MELKFDDLTYEGVLTLIKGKKSLWKEVTSLTLLDAVDLKECGENNDLDNFQIFTPRFIVDDMIEAIGLDNITDFGQRILEPTSGDGAFTCRILELRLERVKASDRAEILNGLLRALSTIYSIEMDQALIKRQRNNLYTLGINFLKDNGVVLSEAEDALLRLLIVSNLIWAETETENAPTDLLCVVANKMPDIQKGKAISVLFPVWGFTEGKASLYYEEPEIGD